MQCISHRDRAVTLKQVTCVLPLIYLRIFYGLKYCFYPKHFTNLPVMHTRSRTDGSLDSGFSVLPKDTLRVRAGDLATNPVVSGQRAPASAVT